MIVFRPTSETNLGFFGYVTDYLATVLKKARMGRGFTVMHIYSMGLKHLTISIPPVDEQAAIVCFLDDEFEKTNEIIAGKNREIELLREYCTRLIADVVTGKLDVRDLASQLPEIVAEDSKG